jgi:hypothetical protein
MTVRIFGTVSIVDGERLKLLLLIYMHMLLVIAFLERVCYGGNFSSKVYKLRPIFLSHYTYGIC